MNTLTIVPAYGKDYRTAKDAIQAWKQGTDFQTEDGSYVSCRDATELRKRGTRWLNIRYQSLTQVAVVQP